MSGVDAASCAARAEQSIGFARGKRQESSPGIVATAGGHGQAVPGVRGIERGVSFCTRWVRAAENGKMQASYFTNGRISRLRSILRRFISCLLEMSYILRQAPERALPSGFGTAQTD